MSQNEPDSYEKLKLELAEVRKRHNGEESQEEEVLLDKMDTVWKKMHP
jgi:hypothetical protein